MSALVDATIAMLRREVSTWRARAERAETELLDVKLQLARVTADRDGQSLAKSLLSADLTVTRNELREARRELGR